MSKEWGHGYHTGYNIGHHDGYDAGNSSDSGLMGLIAGAVGLVGFGIGALLGSSESDNTPSTPQRRRDDDDYDN
jgi:hypothetical protein